MKTWILTLFALLVMSSTAQAADKREIRMMLDRIDNELRNYDQSPQMLDEVRSKLAEALQILRGGPVDGSDACREFAFDVYTHDGYSNSVALEKAKTYCEKVAADRSSLNVVRFCFDVYVKDGYSGSVSLDKGQQTAKGLPEAKLGCVRTASARYVQDGYSGSVALDKAVNYCR